MAFDKLDLTQVEDTSGDFEPIPDGKYMLQAVHWKDDPSSTGRPMLTVQFSVAEGNYHNRIIFENFVLTEPVALGRLKSWVASCGLEAEIKDFNSSHMNDLMNTKFQANVKIQPAKGEYGASNGVKSFLRPSNGDQAQEAETPAAADAPAQPKPKWSK